ncbi:hypothetical protein L2C91_03080 [Rosenbergiella epipactidis]|uniref:hypothetical protein n=1 Tax=Rosenbergiella epipactidis TaxID=1544694 RepID=UPI001F4D3D9D|nr:hypothetical protein [Rosenbergiella epipactidis]MCL9667362.1 hypothetical protein [Rosenbergiella epipactidis]
MLLFSENTKVDDVIENSILVVTSDPNKMESVCEQLAMRDVGEIKRFLGNIEQLESCEDTINTDCIVFDASHLDSPDSSIETINLQISKNVNKIAFSTKDSLLLADEFEKKDVRYCLYPTQLNRMGGLVHQTAQDKTYTNSAIRITLMSCKGGIGGSMLSYQAAEFIANKRQSPTLIVQGAYGSQNLDLISKVAISNEVTLLQKNLSGFYEDKSHAWQYYNPAYENFECIVFDFTAYNAADENIENVLTHTDCLLLICDRDISSARTAKKIIEANNHLMNSNNGVRRLYVCHNQHHGKISGEINTQEISGLIGKSVDLTIPYLTKPGDPSLPLNFSGKNIHHLENLCNLLLGKKGHKPSKTSLLDSIKKIGQRG